MGLSQGEVSDRCGYHVLSHWVLKENGQALVSITDIMEFCELIGWTPIQFQTFMMVCKNHVERAGITISTVKNSQAMRANGYYRANQELMQKCIGSAAQSVAEHPEQLKWWATLRAKTIN